MTDRPISPTHPARLAGWEWLLITAILLGGFALRVAHFLEVPPGVIHDEVLDWFNAELVSQGDIRAMYPYYGGREALYMFLLAGAFKLIGANLLALRFPALAFSMLGIAISFALTRRLFGRTAGMVAAGGMATSYWALTFARLGERPGTAPVMGLIAAYLFLILIASRRSALWRYGAAGVALGAALYTYPSALVFPLILLAWMVAIAWLKPRWLARKWPGFALSFAIAGLMAIPLALAWRDPSTTARADAVDAPLEALLAGDPGPVVTNILPVLGAFSVRGDHGLEFNLQNQPIFPTSLMAILFYGGVLVAVIGLARGAPDSRPGYALALLWLIGLLAPTLATDRPVNPYRTIGLLGIVYVFPALAVTSAARWLREHQQRFWRSALLAAAVLALLIQLQHTARSYFTTWAENPVVRFLYQDEYRHLARHLDTLQDHPPVAVGGLTPLDMDLASMRLLMRDDSYAEAMGYFDPQTSLLLPVPDASGITYIAVPASITLHPVLTERLGGWDIEPESADDAYTLYVARMGKALVNVSSSGEFLFYEPGDQTALVSWIGLEPVGEMSPGQSFTLLTYWIANGPSQAPLKIFLHLLSADGNLLAQSDVLGVPSTQWRVGDLIVQAHDLTLPPDAPPSPYLVRLGMYDPQNNTRLKVGDPSGGEYVEIALR